MLSFPCQIFTLLLLVCLSSCNGTYRNYYQNLKMALNQPTNANMTLEEVKNSSMDVLSVTKGERATAILALAYIENGQHKWVSGDNAMLIMEKGRIVRTLGLEQNLTHMSNRGFDPIKNPKIDLAHRSWQFSLDWDNNEYGYPVQSTFSPAQSVQLEILTKKLDTKFYVETLKYQATSSYLRQDSEWRNYYWFESNTGTLVKTKQTLSPLTEPIEMIYLSRIARFN